MTTGRINQIAILNEDDKKIIAFAAFVHQPHALSSAHAGRVFRKYTQHAQKQRSEMIV